MSKCEHKFILLGATINEFSCIFVAYPLKGILLIFNFSQEIIWILRTSRGRGGAKTPVEIHINSSPDVEDQKWSCLLLYRLRMIPRIFLRCQNASRLKLKHQTSP